MATLANPVPAGFHTVTPTLTMRGVEKAIGFYKRGFGAEEKMRFLGPDEKSIMHAEIKIGDSIIFLSEEHPEMGCRGPQSFGGTPVGLYLYVEDADQAFTRAVSAGAKADMPVANMFWGDRCGQLTDPFGHKWTLATHKEDVTPEEMGKRASDFFAQMALHAG
ncbi:MAG: glyoxalase [Nitrospira sp.]|nr:MAG: glyoxalase [Nitrospira sp.]